MPTAHVIPDVDSMFYVIKSVASTEHIKDGYIDYQCLLLKGPNSTVIIFTYALEKTDELSFRIESYIQIS